MSVPSIFSQLFVQAEAFSRVSRHGQFMSRHISSEVERHVSHVLDLFELIFMYGTEVVATRIDLNELLASSADDLLSSIIMEDLQSPIFRGVTNIYLFSWRNVVYGGTSPLTVVYSRPNVMRDSLRENDTLVGTGGNRLFYDDVPLHRRGTAFRRFMYEYNDAYHLPSCLHDYIENALNIRENMPIGFLHPMPAYKVLRDISGAPVIVNGVPIIYALPEVEASSKGKGIAIARDFAVILFEDGQMTRINASGKRDHLGYLSSEWDKVVKITATFNGFLGLTQSGHIVMGEVDADEYRAAERWRDVKDIVGCENHILAVFHDGSVACIDGPGDWTCSPMHKNIVREWSNIKQVAAGFENVMGLTNGGRVLYYCGHYSDFYDRYSDVVQVDCYNHFYGAVTSMVLHKDGTVSSDSFEGVDSWRDIIHISVGADIAIGLKRDGTIEMVDDRGTRLGAKNWNDLAWIECKFLGVVGMTKDGHILSLFS